ncbi:MAG: ATPase, T2SS/T4P/T4SS family [Candidatus Dojkabacteria bacterium]
MADGDKNNNNSLNTDLDLSKLELKNPFKPSMGTTSDQAVQNTVSLPSQEHNSTTAITPVHGSHQGTVSGLTNILDALQVKGIITAQQFNEIRLEALNSNKTFDQVLLDGNYVTSKDLARTYAEMKNIGYIDLANVSIPPDTLSLLPKNIAAEYHAVVFEALPYKVKVAMVDPLDLQKIKYLESIIGREVESFYAAGEDINRIIDTKYGAQIGSEVDDALEEIGDSKKILRNLGKLESSGIDQENAPIIKIVNMILDYAIKHKASDVHIEPREDKISVRFRIRGVLTEKLTVPRKLLPAIVTRIKILSDLKIDEHRIPQDGRFPIHTKSGQVDIRVSIMPAIHGEKIVMRILDKTQGIMSLEDTGVRGIAYKRIKDALSKTQGIILVTGPTGSGKTQTLASFLKILNTSEVNIVTLEDPVEIRIDGVNQVQINQEVGLTFASGLRSILRQDPDIIMVGEIRDRETASLAVQAALIGRLVLSTVHTNSAAGAFVRLIDMGIEPFLLTSTVNIVIGQRLVRTLSSAKRPYQAPPEVVEKFHEVLDPLKGVTVTRPDGTKVEFNENTKELILYEPVSTPQAESGYDGRTGIFEALISSESISQIVARKGSIAEIEEQAIKEGMITMEQDGFIKALEGITTVEEILRVRTD